MLVGRATSAITIALRARRLGGKIAIPDILCPNPANAALYAGMEPVFCDIQASDATIDPASARMLVERRSDVTALLAPHLYGHPADMNALEGLAEEAGLFLIEDVAQALGGTLRGRPLGSYGDVSVVSFSRSKILDTGHGGAVLTDDPDLAEGMAQEAAALPRYHEGLDELFEQYRTVYYELWDLAQLNPDLHPVFDALPHAYKEMYLFQFEDRWTSKILDALATLQEEVDRRRRNWQAYREHLQHPLIQHLEPAGTFTPWRFSFLLDPSVCDSVVEALRGHGIDVSQWYPPLHRWYPSGRSQPASDFQTARWLEPRMVNLWVDDTVDPRTVQDHARTALDLIEQHRSDDE